MPPTRWLRRSSTSKKEPRHRTVQERAVHEQKACTMRWQRADVGVSNRCATTLGRHGKSLEAQWSSSPHLRRHL